MIKSFFCLLLISQSVFCEDKIYQTDDSKLKVFIEQSISNNQRSVFDITKEYPIDIRVNVGIKQDISPKVKN
jgi:hypothetical protein